MPYSRKLHRALWQKYTYFTYKNMLKSHAFQGISYLSWFSVLNRYHSGTHGQRRSSTTRKLHDGILRHIEDAVQSNFQQYFKKELAAPLIVIVSADNCASRPPLRHSSCNRKVNGDFYFQMMMTCPIFVVRDVTVS